MEIRTYDIYGNAEGKTYALMSQENGTRKFSCYSTPKELAKSSFLNANTYGLAVVRFPLNGCSFIKDSGNDFKVRFRRLSLDEMRDFSQIRDIVKLGKDKKSKDLKLKIVGKRVYHADEMGFENARYFAVQDIDDKTGVGEPIFMNMEDLFLHLREAVKKNSHLIIDTNLRPEIFYKDGRRSENYALNELNESEKWELRTNSGVEFIL